MERIFNEVVRLTNNIKLGMRDVQLSPKLGSVGCHPHAIVNNARYQWMR